MIDLFPIRMITNIPDDTYGIRAGLGRKFGEVFIDLIVPKIIDSQGIDGELVCLLDFI